MLVKHSQRTVKCKRCGVREFYWMHDTNKTAHAFRRCTDGSNDCKVEGLEGRPVSWVLCDYRGNVHRCGNAATEVTAEETTELEDAELPSEISSPVVNTPAPTETPSGDLAALQAILGRLVGSSVDAEQVRVIVKSEIQDLVFPTVVTLKSEATGETREVEGAVHKVFPQVLAMLQAGDNIWMTGPAGTGKSTIAHQCAEALEVQFGSISLSVTTPVSEIVGYRDANGIYHDTAFRRVYEHGGVFLFDEVDNGNPNTLGKVNEALSNGSMEFPDRRVERHKDCHVLAAGNTYGTGPDRQYVGRMQLDAATLDRFAQVFVPIDEALETQVTRSQGASGEDTEWVLSTVRRLRRKADEVGLNVIFSPRASIYGAKLLASGLSRDQVMAVRIRRGISDTDWRRLER